MINPNKNNSDKTVSERDFDLLHKAEAIHSQDETNYILMTQVYPFDYLQRQLAEECSELAQAALKLIRAYNDETPEPMQQVTNNYIEELADVWVMLSLALQELDADEMQYCADVCQYKRDRLHQRLCEAAAQGRGDYAKTAEDDVACPRCYVEKDDEPDQDDDQDDVWDRLDEAWADLDEALTRLEAEKLARRRGKRWQGSAASGKDEAR